MTPTRHTDALSIECRMSGISKTLSKIDPVSSFDRIYCAEHARNGLQPIENYGAVDKYLIGCPHGMNGSIDFLHYRVFDPATVFPALLDDASGGSLRLDSTSIAYEFADSTWHTALHVKDHPIWKLMTFSK